MMKLGVNWPSMDETKLLLTQQVILPSNLYRFRRDDLLQQSIYVKLREHATVQFWRIFFPWDNLPNNYFENIIMAIFHVEVIH